MAREWYPDGSLFRESQYAEGQEAGRQRMWHADGTLRSNYIVREGQRYGLIGSKGCTGADSDPKERIS
jgi:antitoxin component YwqK of YwqJK toxin-antitoxin module